MFLGLDDKAENVFFLTNRKLANLANSVTDAVEARFSSPPIVKMISFEQLKTLRTLQNKVDNDDGSIIDQSDSASNGKVDEEEDMENAEERISELMDGLPCWDVRAEDEIIDFYRTYSMDYPYCEGYLHNNASQMTLYFNGHDMRISVTLTMTLVKSEPVQEQSSQDVGGETGKS